MTCPECNRLESERALRQLVYTTAASRLRSAALNTKNHEEYMRLRARADEARIDLDLVLAEIAQHRDRHAVAN